MMMGVSDAYLIPYGIVLGATPSQIASLTAIPMVIATLLQVRSAAVTQSIGSRTKLISFIKFWYYIVSLLVNSLLSMGVR